jgi:hypothetical protein
MRTTQTNLETTTSVNALDAMIRVTVEATDISSLVVKYNDYLATLAKVESSHKDFHIELLYSVDATKAINTILRTLVKEATTATSYIDRNVIASKIGKKLLPKNVKGTSLNKASMSLTLGLNLVNIAASMNLVGYKVLVGKDQHTISTLVVNPNLVEDTIKEANRLVRANNIMVCRPQGHTPSAPGGFITKAQTMLNSNGFNSVKTQSISACQAINALQDVAYSIRGNLTEDILCQYAAQDKWFNEKGQFMQGEWDKLMADIKLAEQGKFYFAVACDDRGRMYELSAYLKYQGDKFQKAMLEFNKKEYCTDEGLTYLAIAVANELYSDKVEFNDAVEFIESKELEELTELAKGNPIAQTLVADYIDAQDGKPIGTITHWDATNSGLQFYALLGADKQTASLCNVFDTGVIADAYQALANALNIATQSEAFNRSNVKNSFMVFLYGSMAKNILHCIEDKKNGVVSGIAEFFPSDWNDEMMWEAFTTSMETIAPAAIKLMNLIYSYNIEGSTKFRWTMPDGFKVETTSVVSYSGKDSDDKNKQVRGWFLDLQGKTHEGVASVKIEEYAKFSRALAPNVIHSIDAFFGREVIRRLQAMSIEVSFIHDSFGVHPNNASTLHQVVREVAAYILELNLLENILSQLNPAQTAWNVSKGRLARGILTVEDVLNSAYMVR